MGQNSADPVRFKKKDQKKSKTRPIVNQGCQKERRVDEDAHSTPGVATHREWKRSALTQATRDHPEGGSLSLALATTPLAPSPNGILQ